MNRKKTKKHGKGSRSLRNRAEAILNVKPAEVPALSTTEVQNLVHELNVHQVELELQNQELRDAQLEMAQLRDRYTDLFDFAPLGYVTLSKDGKILLANLTVANQLGTDRNKLVGANITDFVSADSQDTLFLHLQAVFSTHNILVCELSMRSKDGTSMVMRLESIQDPAQDSPQCRAALLDISDWKQTERRLKESEERLRLAAEATGFGNYDFDPDSKISIWSPELFTLSGIPETTEVMERRIINLVHPDDRDQFMQEVEQSHEPSETGRHELEFRIVRPDGTVRWIRDVGQTLFAEEGGKRTPVRIIGTVIDITEQKELNEKLRLVNQALEQTVADQTRNIQLQATAIERLAEGVIITGDNLNWPEPKIHFVNDALCRMTGYTQEELVGKTPRLLYGNNVDRKIQKWIKAELIANRPCRAELTHFHKDGTPYEVEMFITPIHNEEGDRTHFVAIHRDITKRKQAERTLRKNERQFRALFDQAIVGILQTNTQGRIKMANDYFVQLLGYPREELLKQSLQDLTHPEDWPEFASQLEMLLKSGNYFEMRKRIRCKDGTYKWVETGVNGITDPEGHIRSLEAIVVDVSERLHLEQEILQISEVEKRQLAHDLHDNICQEIGGLAYMTDNLADNLYKESHPATDQAKRIAEKIKESLESVRQLSHSLDPLMEDPDDFYLALRLLAETTEDVYGVQCRFEQTTELLPDNINVAINLYRIAQESVYNAIRHGKATRITLKIDGHENRITLKIADNGCGLPDASALQKGIGMSIMKYRTGMLKGRIGIENRQNGGVAVTCSVPLEFTQ